jgi:RHS repeat-associated protein
VTDSYEYDAFGNKINSTGTTPNSYLYRGEQYDPDLSLYYLRARYYNQATGRFLNVDPLAGDGQRRYEYAGADPVDGMDSTGNQVLFEYRPLIPPPLYWNPKFCFSGAGGSPMSEYLPSCTGPAGPPSPPNKKVKVCWRPLLKGMIGHPPHALYPLGHWHHTYIEIDAPGQPMPDTWGVLGANGGGKNQEVLHNDPRNSLDNGGGCTDVPCSNSEADTLADMLNSSVYPGSTCPSCGANYHNWWWRIPPDGYNSNTYTYNMINNWGKTPPAENNVPGYHYAPGYAGYF